MRQLLLLAVVIGCCGASKPATQPSTGGYAAVARGMEPMRFFDPVVPGLSKWVRIPPDAVKKNAGMNTEHFVIPIALDMETTSAITATAVTTGTVQYRFDTPIAR